ncbi:MAG: glucan biosynthesis protein [Tepidamorphaceae bacterium]
MSGSFSPVAGARPAMAAAALCATIVFILWNGICGASAQDAASPVFELVKKRAEALAAQDYAEPEAVEQDGLPGSYDSYRKIAFDRERSLWRGSDSGFEVQFMPLGWLFKHEVRIWLIEDGEIKPAHVTAADFIDRRGEDDSHFQSPDTPVPVSGLRINWPLNQPDKPDEVIVFQGASYFRALARGQQYGLSARGLAIGTASPEGEEFPEFREFWIEKPGDHSLGIDIYALLDSPSASGAYHFHVQPGDVTFVDVDSVIYPRREIANVGIAPLTSMFMLGPIDRTRKDDFRPEVHDSDGLAILNGSKERLWRPLSNPRTLQVSAFVDNGNNGFGLIQRERRFERYEDLEARYDLRPSTWVEPLSDFGPGSVMLVEIPTEREIHDNIVAFWRPEQPLMPGTPARFHYRLHWRADSPTREMGPFARTTRAGLTQAETEDEPKHLFVIDYTGQENLAETLKTGELPEAEVTASTGRIENVVVAQNRQSGGLRLTFEFFRMARKSRN